MRGQQKGANGLTHHIIFTLKLQSGLKIRFVFDIITLSAFTPQQAPGLNIYLYMYAQLFEEGPLLFFVKPTLKSVQKKMYANVNGQQFPQLMHTLELEYKFSQYNLYDFGFYSCLLLDYCTFSRYNITEYNIYVISIIFLFFNIC